MAKYYVNVSSFGTFWYKDPEMKIRHREDGPAMEWINGDKSWWIDGKVHRLDGPAIEHATGIKYWFKDGERLTKEEWEVAIRPVEELTVAQIEQLLGKRIKVIK